jgi:hypothetical protein
LLRFPACGGADRDKLRPRARCLADPGVSETCFGGVVTLCVVHRCERALGGVLPRFGAGPLAVSHAVFLNGTTAALCHDYVVPAETTNIGSCFLAETRVIAAPTAVNGTRGAAPFVQACLFTGTVPSMYAVNGGGHVP